MAVSKAQRMRIFVRDNLICRYCRRVCVIMTTPSLQPPETATIDHLDPDGGDDDRNLATACKGCNSRKHARTEEQFQDYMLERFDWDETRL